MILKNINRERDNAYGTKQMKINLFSGVASTCGIEISGKSKIAINRSLNQLGCIS
jgi:hypothetical protein